MLQCASDFCQYRCSSMSESSFSSSLINSLLLRWTRQTSSGLWSWTCSPDQRGEGQQHAERQRHEANASRSGRRSTGHQLQELLSLFVGGSARSTVTVGVLQDGMGEFHNCSAISLTISSISGTNSSSPETHQGFGTDWPTCERSLRLKTIRVSGVGTWPLAS